jgi:hypothetical protein
MLAAQSRYQEVNRDACIDKLLQEQRVREAAARSNTSANEQVREVRG